LSALATATARHPGTARREQFGVHTERHDIELPGIDTEIVGDIGGRRRGDGEQIGDPPGDALLHTQKAVPAAHQRFAPPDCRGQVHFAVLGDGMVHGGHQRQPFRDIEQPTAETLVVVHDIEIVDPSAQQAGRAQAEGARFRETGGPHGGQFQQIDPVPDLTGMRRAERVVVAIEVQAGHLGQGYARIQVGGIGLTGEDLHVVAEFGQSGAEAAHVDPLPTAMRLAAVGQQGYPH
jgi:hypothetical protein